MTNEEVSAYFVRYDGWLLEVTNDEVSACFVRYDGWLFEVTNEEANQVHGGTPGGLDVAEAKRDSSLRKPTRSQEVNAQKGRRPAPFGMTVGCLK